MASLRVVSSNGFAFVVNGCSRGALCRNEFSFAVLSCRYCLLPPVSNRISVIGGGVEAMYFPSVLASRKVVAAATKASGFRARNKVVLFVCLGTLCFLRLLSATLCLCNFDYFVTRAFSGVLDILCLFLLVLVNARLLLATFFARCSGLIMFCSMVMSLSTNSLGNANDSVVRRDPIITSRRCNVNAYERRIFRPLSALSVGIIN